MPTLFNRIYAYSKTNNLPMLTLEQRSELGVKAVESFKVSGIDKKYKRVKAKDFDCKGLVIYYPVEFKSTLDNLIKDYYDNPPSEPFVYVRPVMTVKKPKEEKIPKIEPLPIKKRKVIKRKAELVYSTKNQ